MSHAQNMHDGTGILQKDPGFGILSAFGLTVPPANSVGYAPGCQFYKVNGSTPGTVQYINIGTKAACNFVSVGVTGLVCATFVYGEGTIIDQPFFTANDRDYVIQSIVCRPVVAGTDAGAVTGQIKKVNTTVSIASGAAVHSGTIDFKGTINTNQVLTLSTVSGITTVTNRWSLALDLTGVPTAARGVITVFLLPA